MEKRNSLLVAILIFICVMRKNKEHGNDNGGFNCLFCARSSLDGWVLLALKARSVVALLWLAVEAGWLAEGDLDTDFTAESVKFGPVGSPQCCRERFNGGDFGSLFYDQVACRPGRT